MKFDMNRAWNEAVAMISANREVLLIVAGLFFFIPNALLTLVQPQMPAGFTFNPEDMQQLEGVVLDYYTNWWWLMVLGLVAVMIGWLALMALLRDDSKPTVGQAIATGAKGLLPALATLVIFIVVASFGSGLLVALASVTGSAAVAVLVLLACVIAMIALSVRMALVSPVIAIEGVMNPFTVIRRSWQLTAGNSWRLLGFFLLLSAAYLVLSMVAGIVLGGLSMIGGSTVGGFLTGILGGLVSAVASLIWVAVIAAIHRQLAGPSATRIQEEFE